MPSLSLVHDEPGLHVRSSGDTAPEEAPLRQRLDQLSKKPLSFWFLNQWLEEEELSRQIHELKEKNFGGFFIHPRGGLEVPYGSRRWYDVVGHCIREAERLGLEAWLYDEDPYPSGAAGGQVTLENPALRAMELKAIIFNITQPGDHTLDLPAGMLHAAYLVDAGGVHSINEEAGLVRTQWRQGMRFNSYYPPYGDQGTPHWRAEAHSPHFRIVARVRRTPATLLAFVKTPVAQNPWGDYPDLLNSEAVESFIRLTHERYGQKFGQKFGTAVPGIFTDESKLKGGIPWSASLDGFVQETGGVTLDELLPHLPLHLNEQTPWFRWVFREALARGFLTTFVDRVREACRSRGLLWTGHFSPEEDPVSQVLHIPGLYRLLTRMDIPGTDLIGANLGDTRHPLLCLSPKLASSAAHVGGKSYVACEALAVTDWVQDFDFISRAVHWLFALGVNRIVIHGQYYSIDGPRKREAPPSQFFQAAGWEHMPPLAGEIELLGEHLSRGVHRAPVLLYYPEETFMVYACNCPEGHSEQEHSAAQEQREKLGTLSHQLLTHGYDFDFIDSENLAKVKIREACPQKRLSVTGEEHSIILVPGTYLTESAWRHLAALRKGGATIWFVEDEVTILSREPRSVRVDAPAGGDLLTRLKALLPPQWRAKHPLIGHRRETREGPLLFLCNNTRESFSGSVEPDFHGPYEICHPALGQWMSTGERLEINLPPGLGVLIRRQKQTRRLNARPADWLPLAATFGRWKATPLGENCLLLHEFALATAPSCREPKLPPAEAFFGAPLVDLASPSSLHAKMKPGEDRFFLSSFDWSGPMGKVRLVCDSDLLPTRPGRKAPEKLFYVNGISLPPLKRRHTFDPMNLECALSEFLHEGRNTLVWVQRGEDELPLPYDGLRLFGDFHVDLPFSRAMLANLSRRPEYYWGGDPTPPQQLGHLHFPGIMEYRSTTILPRVPGRVALRFQRVYESIQIVVNGCPAGYLWTEPYLLEIDRDLLHDGANDILLRCATSPANYLLGSQRPAGCLGPVEWCAIP